MPIDTDKLSALFARVAAGETLRLGEYIRVDWDESHTNYYGTEAYQQTGGYLNIGLTIEPRLIPRNKKDPFFEYEICPDLRTDNITVEFDDIDKSITGKFQTYSSGVACAFFLYYPDEDLHIEMWSGQLQAPQVYGWKTVKATATNGYRSRELLLPNRGHRAECTAQVFGGRLPTLDAVRSALCPYDRHLGGVIGKLNPATGEPYLDCDKSRESCILRLDMNNDGKPEYFGGFATSARAINSPYKGHPFLALGRGNASNITDPVRVVFGTKNVRNLPALIYRIQSPPHTEDAWVQVVFEVCEGPIVRFGGYLVNSVDYSSGQWSNYFNARKGERGQSLTSFPGTDANYSGTAIFYAVYGGPHIGLSSDDFDPASLSAFVSVQGFAEVCVYSDPETKVRQYSDDRVFCLLELFTNQKFGLGYSPAKFNLQDWIDTSDWTNLAVTHTLIFPDGETRTYTSRRSSFNAILEGRQVSEQIEDICRAGAFSVPFQFEDLFTISPFRAATTDELNNARVYTDTGESKNIVWDSGKPSLDLSQTPDNKVINEVELRFEDQANGDIERTLTVDDPDQKLKAGRQLGTDYFLSVPKRFVGTGINNFAEAIRMAYRLLKFGQFDEGGTDNNLKVTLKVPLIHALGVKRYEIIKIQSSLLDHFTLPSGVLTDTNRYPVEYFRVLKLKKIAGDRCEITAQVYNHNSYTHFEVDLGGGGGYEPVLSVLDAGTQTVRGVYAYDAEDNGYDSYAYNEFRIGANLGGTRWELYSLNDLGGRYIYYYTSGTMTAGPWEASWTGATHGALPLPTVRVGIPPTRPARELTIGTPVVDHSTGLVNVTIGT